MSPPPSQSPIRVDAPWCKMPMALVRDSRYSRAHLAVFGELDFRAGRRGWYYGLQADLAGDLGLSLSRVNHALSDLRAAGFVVVLPLPGHRINRYAIPSRTTDLPPPDVEELERFLQRGTTLNTAFDYAANSVPSITKRVTIDKPKRGAGPPRPTRPHNEPSPEALEALIAEYAGPLGGEARARLKVERFINLSGYRSAKDRTAYVRNRLDEDVLNLKPRVVRASAGIEAAAADWDAQLAAWEAKQAARRAKGEPS